MSLDDFSKELAGLIGLNDEAATVSMWLDTGYPPLNFALSGRYDGGMPAGRIVEMFGPPSAGKTAISTKVMAAAQAAGGVAAFMDHERSFDINLGAKLGLETSFPRFIYKTPRTFEESINNGIKLGQALRQKKAIPDTAPIAIVWDSLASMVPQSKMEKDVDGYTMADQTALPRATSAVFPALAQWAEELNMLCLFLNQMRTKPGVVYGDPTTTPGGDSPKYYASTRIQLGAKRLTTGTGETKEIVGQEIGCNVVKNKVARPFMKASWRFMFQPDGTGKFDTVGSMVDFMIANKLLDSSGARVTWKGKSYYKSQLAEVIEKAGEYGELLALLPSTLEPVVEIPVESDGAEAA